jgi:hypothetical protein
MIRPVSVGVVVTLIVTVVLAFSGYLLTYMLNLRLARRKDYLGRVNRQLSEFYGPLYALTEASGRAWKELLAITGSPPERMVFTEDNIHVWRRWVIHVFMPLDRKMMDIVVTHADLLVDQEFPSCLEDLCAHVVCYEPVIERWRQENVDSIALADNVSVIDFPAAEVQAYVKRCYDSLKREQTRLIAQIQRS